LILVVTTEDATSSKVKEIHI